MLYLEENYTENKALHYEFADKTEIKIPIHMPQLTGDELIRFCDKHGKVSISMTYIDAIDEVRMNRERQEMVTRFEKLFKPFLSEND